jgi:hypothetical protein
MSEQGRLTDTEPRQDEAIPVLIPLDKCLHFRFPPHEAPAGVGDQARLVVEEEPQFRRQVPPRPPDVAGSHLVEVGDGQRHAEAPQQCDEPGVGRLVLAVEAIATGGISPRRRSTRTY